MCMKSILIRDTTKSERIALIKEWQEPEDGFAESDIDLFEMYREYIDGIKEIAQINAEFNAGFYEESDLRDETNCGPGGNRHGR